MRHKDVTLLTQNLEPRRRSNTSRIIIIFLSIIIAFFVLVTSSPCSTIQLPRTGQTKCYNTDGDQISCSGTGQDGEYQMGVKWPDPRFTITYCNEIGPCPESSIDCDGNAYNDVVTDNLTGLMWARDRDLPGGTLSWPDAINFTNELILCGYSDWRLPNLVELESMSNPAENIGYYPWEFPYASGVDYWSSSGVDGNGAWISYLNGGGNTHPVPEYNYAHLYTWPVRGETSPPAQFWQTGIKTSYRAGDDGDLRKGVVWPAPRFTDHGDGTVTDNLTGLMWTQNANAPGPDTCNPEIGKSWQSALKHVACLNKKSYLNYNDWRLPNRKELFSLIDLSRVNPALPQGHPFTDVQPESFPPTSYWTSTTSGFLTDLAWTIDILWGYVHYEDKFVRHNHIWPVRGPGYFGKLYTLTVALANKGRSDGIITSGDGIINCPDSCTTRYYEGTEVTLTAKANEGSTFIGWKPTPLGCESSNPVCQISMNEKKSIKAAFQGPNKLKVVTTFKNGGTGTVTSGDANINCPGDCEELYILNAPVTLTATAEDGSTFVKWTGRTCKDEPTNICTFTMDKNATVKAIFEPNP
jgi:hypothetical protein